MSSLRNTADISSLGQDFFLKGQIMKSLLLATTAFVALAGAGYAADALTSVAIMPTDEVLAPGLSEKPVAEGRFKVENPSKYIGYYGYGNDGPLTAPAGAKPAKDAKFIEATKTEPDKNTYLVLEGQKGA